MFSEKGVPVRKESMQAEAPAFRREGNPPTRSVEKTRRKIKLEGKKELPNLREALDAYVKAKTLTWSAASAKDIPPQVRQFVEIVRELEQGRDILWISFLVSISAATSIP